MSAIPTARRPADGSDLPLSTTSSTPISKLPDFGDSVNPGGSISVTSGASTGLRSDDEEAQDGHGQYDLYPAYQYNVDAWPKGILYISCLLKGQSFLTYLGP